MNKHAEHATDRGQQLKSLETVEHLVVGYRAIIRFLVNAWMSGIYSNPEGGAINLKAVGQPPSKKKKKKKKKFFIYVINKCRVSGAWQPKVNLV